MKLTAIQEVVWIAFFSALLAVSAFIALPIGPIPFTLQVLVLFLTALILGPKRAAIAVLLYVFLGLIGFPFFSGGKSGLATVLAPTGGFILAFTPTAFLAGFAQNKKIYLAIPILLFSLCFFYSIGALWLLFTLDVSLQKAFALAVAPFILVDLAKLAMAYGIFYILAQQNRLPFQNKVHN